MAGPSAGLARRTGTIAPADRISYIPAGHSELAVARLLPVVIAPIAMIDPLARIAANLVARITGPLTFRLVLQPAIAITAGVRAGVADARNGRPAYLWAIFSSPAHRRELLRDGWKDVTKVFAAAFVVDLVYQWIATRWIYPGEALLVAFLLACVPYVLVRGLANRITRARMQRGGAR
jgi:hypothetical protein